MIDLAGSGDHASISASDFVFKHGNDNTPGSWASVTATATVGVRLTDGDGGSDRVTITFATGAIRNEWLEVQVLATTNTGLSAADVHYWGNKVADTGTGTPATIFQTTTADALQVFATGTGSAAIDNLRDFNRDGAVSTTDALITFANGGTIQRINIPAPPPPAASDGTSAVASALSLALVSSDAATEVSAPIDLPAAIKEPASAPARRFFQQLGEASDPRASIMLAALDTIDDTLALDEWLDGTAGRV
jgi:hypothetical protein